MDLKKLNVKTVKTEKLIKELKDKTNTLLRAIDAGNLVGYDSALKEVKRLSTELNRATSEAQSIQRNMGETVIDEVEQRYTETKPVDKAEPKKPKPKTKPKTTPKTKARAPSAPPKERGEERGEENGESITQEPKKPSEAPEPPAKTDKESPQEEQDSASLIQAIDRQIESLKEPEIVPETKQKITRNLRKKILGLYALTQRGERGEATAAENVLKTILQKIKTEDQDIPLLGSSIPSYEDFLNRAPFYLSKMPAPESDIEGKPESKEEAKKEPIKKRRIVQLPMPPEEATKELELVEEKTIKENSNDGNVELIEDALSNISVAQPEGMFDNFASGLSGKGLKGIRVIGNKLIGDAEDPNTKDPMSRGKDLDDYEDFSNKSSGIGFDYILYSPKGNVNKFNVVPFSKKAIKILGELKGLEKLQPSAALVIEKELQKKSPTKVSEKPSQEKETAFDEGNYEEPEEVVLKDKSKKEKALTEKIKQEFDDKGLDVPDWLLDSMRMSSKVTKPYFPTTYNLNYLIFKAEKDFFTDKIQSEFDVNNADMPSLLEPLNPGTSVNTKAKESESEDTQDEDSAEELSEGKVRKQMRGLYFSKGKTKQDFSTTKEDIRKLRDVGITDADIYNFKKIPAKSSPASVPYAKRSGEIYKWVAKTKATMSDAELELILDNVKSEILKDSEKYPEFKGLNREALDKQGWLSHYIIKSIREDLPIHWKGKDQNIVSAQWIYGLANIFLKLAMPRLKVAGDKNKASEADYMYHVTYYKDLGSIADSGLNPGGGSAMGKGGHSGHSRGRTFMTEKDGLSFWFGRMEEHAEADSDDPLGEGYVPVSLRFPKPKGLEEDEAGTSDAMAESYFLEGSVPPGEVELWDGNSWIALTSWESVNPEESFDVDEYDGEKWHIFKGDNPLYPG